MFSKMISKARRLIDPKVLYTCRFPLEKMEYKLELTELENDSWTGFSTVTLNRRSILFLTDLFLVSILLLVAILYIDHKVLQTNGFLRHWVPTRLGMEVLYSGQPRHI